MLTSDPPFEFVTSIAVLRMSGSIVFSLQATKHRSFFVCLEPCQFGSTMPLQSFSCSSMPFFALDYLHLESVLLLKSSARLGSSLFVLDLLHLCVIFLLRSYARLDLPTVVSDHVPTFALLMPTVDWPTFMFHDNVVRHVDRVYAVWILPLGGQTPLKNLPHP